MKKLRDLLKRNNFKLNLTFRKYFVFIDKSFTKIEKNFYQAVIKKEIDLI